GRSAGIGHQVEDLGRVAGHTGAGLGADQLGDRLALGGEEGVDVDQRLDVPVAGGVGGPDPAQRQAG
ncbi:MAG TPA: hypothetical protein VIJ32_14455, partial [Actinomycetes bacterium]